MFPECAPLLTDHLVERSEIRLEVREFLLPSPPVLGLARTETLSKSGRVEILEPGLFLESHPSFVDVYALANEQPVKIRNVAAEQPLDHAAQLLSGHLLERLRPHRRALV
jgi:hypothetical protein